MAPAEIRRQLGRLPATFAALRAALDAVRADAPDDEMDAEEHASVQTLLTELEQRVCRTVPAQGAGPSPEEVAAAIRADPEAARAAAAALAANA
ncbi:hypothetical protein [Streptomyces griseus]|uniref:hypothetical protein n=1 Tax=Streptomyces griseus TaxID=1911 RepID=UPI0037888E07